MHGFIHEVMYTSNCATVSLSIAFNREKSTVNAPATICSYRIGRVISRWGFSSSLIAIVKSWLYTFSIAPDRTGARFIALYRVFENASHLKTSSAILSK